MIEQQLREKVVEALVTIEHLPFFTTPDGMMLFAGICEMLGRCCRHLAEGKRDHALRVAMTVGRSIPHALPVGSEREVLENALEEVIAVLEAPEDEHLH